MDINKEMDLNDFSLKKSENILDKDITLHKVMNIDVTSGSTLDKNSEKYMVALKFVNGILENINKSKINDLTEFNNVDRNDIIIEKNIELLTKMEPEIWKHYSKVKCGAYHKSDNRVLNILRGMIRENNLKINITRKDISEKTGVLKGFRRAHFFYCIK
jgi:hypothetical protein